MSKVKTRCPGCSEPIKARKHVFCTACGRRNPLLAPRVVRRRTAAKAADPVADMETWRQQRAWREITASPDPDQREFLFKSYFSDFLKGGGAA